MTDEPTPRLSKIIALRMGVSRREADEMIETGRVTVDGKPAQLGARVREDARVEVDGQPAVESPSYRYVMLHKPAGYVCSRKAQGETPTIYELLPADMMMLKTVGRLDKDSSGLILLTNDGDFAHRMTHPKFVKTKIYHVELHKPLAPLHQQMISDYGVQIGDGVSKFLLERIDDSRHSWIITMTEGRNRQIRRTFSALDYDIVSLHRTAFGPYALGDLSVGKHEDTTAK